MRFIKGVLVFIFIFSGNMAAGECPEIEGSLRFELYKQMPQFEIAFPETRSKTEKDLLTTKATSPCPYLVEVESSVYVLLKDKENSTYRLVQARTGAGKSKNIWVIQTISEFSDDIPALEMVRSGYYSDMVSGETLAITRSSSAVQVKLLQHGKIYIYKSKGETGYDSCRIK